MSDIVKKRELWIDFAKVFAIFLVLWGHCIQQFNSSFKESGIFIWIYSFHMPLFMVLAGLFINEEKLRNGLAFISKRFKHLILPCIIWITVMFIISNILGCQTKEFVRCLWYDLWFLKSLFACSLILTICYYLTRRFNVSILMSLFISQLTLAIPYLWHLQLQTMLPSLIVGIYIPKLLRGGYLRIIVLTVICSVLFFFIFPNCSITNLYPPLHKLWSTDFIDVYLMTLKRLFIGLIGSIAIIGFIFLTFSKGYHSCMVKISQYGKYSMEVYILQSILLEILLTHYLGKGIRALLWIDSIICPLMAIATLSISILICKSIEFAGLPWLFNFNRLKSLHRNEYA